MKRGLDLIAETFAPQIRVRWQRAKTRVRRLISRKHAHCLPLSFVKLS